MNRTLSRIGLALGCLLLLLVIATLPLAATEDSTGFRTLFDGKTLNGWLTAPDVPSVFTVENG
jgi:hypothetical protein